MSTFFVQFYVEFLAEFLLSTYLATSLATFLSTFLATFMSPNSFTKIFVEPYAAFVDLSEWVQFLWSKPKWPSLSFLLHLLSIPGLLNALDFKLYPHIASDPLADVVVLSGEIHFRLGLDYTEILLCLVFFHGSTSSLTQLKRILKTKGLGRRRNPSKLREVCQAVEGELRGSRISVGDRQVTQKVHKKSRQKVGKKIAKNVDKIRQKVGKKVSKNVDKKSLQKRRQKSRQKKSAKKLDMKLDTNVDMTAVMGDRHQQKYKNMKWFSDGIRTGINDLEMILSQYKWGGVGCAFVLYTTNAWWFNSTRCNAPPPLSWAHPRGFVFVLGDLFPTPRHTERDNSHPRGSS